MTQSVFHRRRGIELLTEDHPDHPDRPGLLDELHHNYQPDMPYCVDAYLHDGCTARHQLVIQEYFSWLYPPMGYQKARTIT